jgi:hypothetical protein
MELFPFYANYNRFVVAPHIYSPSDLSVREPAPSLSSSHASSTHHGLHKHFRISQFCIIFGNALTTIVSHDYCKTKVREKRKKKKKGPHESLLYVFDENQQALLKDPLHVPVGPITRARSKKIKEALNGLIQDIWADSTTRHSKLGPKEDEGVINLIQATDGADHA